MPDVIKSAVISEDGKYRYSLGRKWDDGLEIVWIGLNPSVADADIDDPTIRRVIRFSRDWGYGSCVMLNVYAYRATNPVNLPRSDDEAAGPEWARYVKESITTMHPVVAAWGAQSQYGPDKGKAANDLGYVLANRKALTPTMCLGYTAAGHPKHPLYVPADTKPVRFEIRKK